MTPKRRMQEVRGGVIAPCGVAESGRDNRVDAIADRQMAAVDGNQVQPRLAELLCDVSDARFAMRRLQHALV
jgi:hypothetical protein